MKNTLVVESHTIACDNSKIFQKLMRSVPPWYGQVITTLQVAADYLTVGTCYLLSYYFYVGPLERSLPQSLLEFSFISAMIGLVYVFLLNQTGLYRREISLLNIKELRGLFRVGIYAGAILLCVSFYLKSVVVSRLMITSAITMTPIILYIQRQLFYRLHVLFHQKGWAQKKVVVYGAGAIGIHLAKRLLESPSLGMLPIGFLDDNPSKQGQTIKWRGVAPRGGIPVLGDQKEIARLKQYGATTVMIALPSADFGRNQSLVEACTSADLEYLAVPNSYEKFIRDVELFEIGGIPMFRRRSDSASWVYLAAKRALDLVLSSIFLILLAPFFLMAAFLIKVTSPGPVFFRQERIGLNGKSFSIFKFRSMHVDAPKYARTPSDPFDPRITSVGRWLRRTSLDELPQLINVFTGEMSIVGPRPEMPFIVEKYSLLQKRRLLAKPGITGVWQISAARAEPIHENIEYDLFYLANRSILLDIAVIIKTIVSVIRGIGAI